MYQSIKFVSAFLILSSLAHASSISDCVYKALVVSDTKTKVTLKVMSMLHKYGTEKCIYKNGQEVSLRKSQIKGDLKFIGKKRVMNFRAMKYTGKGSNGKTISGERFYLKKI